MVNRRNISFYAIFDEKWQIEFNVSFDMSVLSLLLFLQHNNDYFV